MRYFIVNSGADVVEKLVFSGDDAKADGLVAKHLQEDSALTATELDQKTFDGIPAKVSLNDIQKSWDSFKRKEPTTEESIAYLAKYLGLE